MKKMILTAVMLAAAALCRAQQPAETGERREWLTSFTPSKCRRRSTSNSCRFPTPKPPRSSTTPKVPIRPNSAAEVKDKVLRITERSDARRPDRTSVTVYYNSLERVAIADAVATFDSTLGGHGPRPDRGRHGAGDGPDGCQGPENGAYGQEHGDADGQRCATFRCSSRPESIEAAGVEVMAAEANVTSSGVAALWVTDRFQGKTSTGGKITYKGAPPIVRSGAKFIGGDITRVE